VVFWPGGHAKQRLGFWGASEVIGPLQCRLGLRPRSQRSPWLARGRMGRKAPVTASEGLLSCLVLFPSCLGLIEAETIKFYCSYGTFILTDSKLSSKSEGLSPFHLDVETVALAAIQLRGLSQWDEFSYHVMSYGTSYFFPYHIRPFFLLQ